MDVVDFLTALFEVDDDKGCERRVLVMFLLTELLIAAGLAVLLMAVGFRTVRNWSA